MVYKIQFLVLMKKFEEAKAVDKQINTQCGKPLNVYDAFFNYYECNFDRCDFEKIGHNLNIKVVEEMIKKTKDFKNGLKFGKNQILDF